MTRHHRDLRVAPRSYQRYLLRRIYRLLSSKNVFVRFAAMHDDPATPDRYNVPRNSVGTVDDQYLDDDAVMITIDHRHDIIATLVHECLHVLFPETHELRIQKLERFIMKRMHPMQARRLIVLMTLCVLKTPAT